MEINILSDNDNKNVGRREISFSAVQDDKTASKEQIKQELCKRLNLNPDSTIITEIKQEFGMRRSTGIVHSYGSKEQLEKAEPGYLIKRLSKGEKKEGAEQKEEKPKEAKGKQEKMAGKKEEKSEKKEAKEEKPKEEAKEEEKKE